MRVRRLIIVQQADLAVHGSVAGMVVGRSKMALVRRLGPDLDELTALHIFKCRWSSFAFARVSRPRHVLGTGEGISFVILATHVGSNGHSRRISTVDTGVLLL
jgi:hypothetical protein